MIYCFDLDGTLVTEHMTKGTDSSYHLAEPIPEAIDKVQKLYSEGHKIIIMTGRGVRSGIDQTVVTEHQLDEFNIPYHELIMNQKPHADIYVDDKAWNARGWREAKSNYTPKWFKET